ncbi:unnamed protein product [Rotaria sp. Silwood1]|nr:unnamed protein product [Rotaria sp. Silwood1]
MSTMSTISKGLSAADQQRLAHGKSVTLDKYAELHWHPQLYNKIYICEHRHIKGLFGRKLELHHFPSDVQHLSIFITSLFLDDKVILIPDPYRFSEVNREAFVDQQEWSLYEHVDTEQRYIKDFLFRIDDDDEDDGRQMKEISNKEDRNTPLQDKRCEQASDKLRKNALTTVRHIEFCLSSCNYGSDESAHMGKNLVPLLSSFTPYLQTLRLWRDDDFPWTSIRPKYETKYLCQVFSRHWIKSLRTTQSITEHVAVFQQDLSELVEQLKELVLLDIYGEINREKIEPYRSMVQMHFPNSRVHIEITRFRFWV